MTGLVERGGEWPGNDDHELCDTQRRKRVPPGGAEWVKSVGQLMPKCKEECANACNSDCPAKPNSSYASHWPSKSVQFTFAVKGAKVRPHGAGSGLHSNEHDARDFGNDGIESGCGW